MKKWQKLLQKADGLIKQAQARRQVIDETDDLTDEQREQHNAKITQMLDEAESLQAEAEELKQREQADEQQRARLEQAAAAMNAPAEPATMVIPGEQPGGNPRPQALDASGRRGLNIVVPATVRRYGRLRNFQHESTAYAFGMWALACNGNRRAHAWCQQNGLPIVRDTSGPASNQDHVEGINSQGGFLVPEQFENDLIDLRETYGVFRRNAKVRPMRSDTRSDPRRTGGLTAYFVGEMQQGTASTKTWDRVQLTAKKLMVLSLISNELSEDAVISIGDDLAGEIAYAYTLKEDQCGFLGDGTADYGGIQGICWKFEQNSSLAGHLTPGSGDDTFAELSLADFNQLVGALPVYAHRNAKWYISQYGFANSMSNIMYSAGGNNKMDVGGQQVETFLGYPVERVQVMVGAGDQTGKAMVLFGDLEKSSSFGDRRQTTIDFSRDATVDGKSAFEYDAIGVRGTERFDIVNHDIGDTSTAGPVVALVGNT